MQVTIYIETNNQIQRKQKHRYGYVMESEYRGKLITVEGFGEADETFHGTILTALLEAVNRLLGPCELFVCARDPYTISALINQVPEWKSAGWIKGSGEPIRHAELWKQISERLEALKITKIGAESGRHAYSSWILGEIKKQSM